MKGGTIVAAAIAANVLIAATPASADITREFYAACMKLSHDAGLCRCKAELAPKLIDERMEGYVIASMRGSRDLPADVLRRWGDYQARSDRACH